MLNWWYYGVRYGKGCNPSDLWVKYFTSCKEIGRIRTVYGEPDIIEIRHTFKDADSARNWENKVLKRMKVVSDDKWINKHCNISFKHLPGEINPFYQKKHTAKSKIKMSLAKKGKQTKIPNQETREKMRLARLDKKHTQETKNKIGETKRRRRLEKGLAPVKKRKPRPTYQIIFPDQTVHIIKNLSKFSKEKNLSRSQLRRILDGQTKQHKGYIVSYYIVDESTISI